MTNFLKQNLPVTFLGVLFVILFPLRVHADICANFDNPPAGDFGLAGYASTNWEKGAIKFTPVADCDAVALAAFVGRTGSPAGTMYADLYDDSGGLPGTLLAAGSALSAGGTVAWATSTIASTHLTGGVDYWIVLYSSGANSTSNYYEFDGDTVSSAGANYKSGAWNSENVGGFYSIESAAAPSPTATSTATTTPAVLGATTGLAALGLVAFFTGLATTIWMWKLFLG